MQIDELEIEEVFDLQTEGIFADGRTKCRSKNYLQIEETFASQRIILQTKELFNWQTEERYADQKTIHRLTNCLLIE